MNYISTFFNNIARLLYPVLCPGCGNEIGKSSELLCFECAAALPLTDFEPYADNPVEKIFWGRLPLQTATAYLYFTKNSALQGLLHQLKYKGRKEIGHQLGLLMGEALLRSARFGNVDALIPIPLFFKKEKRRGYNQAAVICEGISLTMKVPVLNRVIARKKNTETQTRKNRAQRWDNIQETFELTHAEKIAGMHVMLVDDVLTTGATLESGGRELLKAPGVQLSIATLAYTIL